MSLHGNVYGKLLICLAFLLYVKKDQVSMYLLHKGSNNNDSSFLQFHTLSIDECQNMELQNVRWKHWLLLS